MGTDITPAGSFPEDINGSGISSPQVSSSHLQTGRAYIEMVAQTISEGLLVMDLDYIVELVNEPFCEHFGVLSEEVEGKPFFDIMGGVWDTPELRRLLSETLPRDNVITGRELVRRFDELGERQLLLSARKPREHPFILLAFEDETEDEPNKHPLEQVDPGDLTEQLLLRALEDLPDIVIVHDVQANTNVWCNMNVMEVLGFTREEFYSLGSTLLAFLIHPDDFEEVYDFYTRWEEDQEGTNRVRCRMLGKDGAYYWVEKRESVFRHDEEGRVKEVLVVARDVTEQQELELERRRLLQQTEQRHRHLKYVLEHIPLGVVLVRNDGMIMYWNRQIEEIFQRPIMSAGGASDFLKWPFFHLESEEEISPAERPLVRALREGETATGREMCLERPDGTVCCVLSNGIPIFDEAGQVEFAVGSFLEITERKKTEQALRGLTNTLEERIEERTAAFKKSEERFRALVDASAQIVWTTDPTGAAAELSPSWGKFTGQSYEEGQGWGWLDVVHPEDQERVKRIFKQALKAEEPVEDEYRLYHGGRGEWRWTQVRAVPLHRKDGSVRGWVGMNTDIHERKQAEEELRALNETLQEQSQKIRELASRLTIAEQQERRRISQVLHDDLQQRLYGIQLKMHGVRRSAEEKNLEELLASLGEAEQWLVKGIGITRQLTVDLSPPVLRNEGLADALGWLVTQMREMHDLDVDLQADHAFVLQDKDMRVLLFQVVRELLFNIVKHAGVKRAGVQLQEDDGVLIIRVLDRGRGFDMEKETDAEEGGKFGLFSARERVRLFGGQMEIDSAPGKGTRVTVRVPLPSD